MPLGMSHQFGINHASNEDSNNRANCSDFVQSLFTQSNVAYHVGTAMKFASIKCNTILQIKFDSDKAMFV